jgi:hypothetical protein
LSQSLLNRFATHPVTRSLPVLWLDEDNADDERPRGVRCSLSGPTPFFTKPVHWPDLFAEMGCCVPLPKKLLEDYSLPEQLTIAQL